MSTPPNIWVGAVRVRPRKDNDMLQGAIGALMPVVAVAADAHQFRGMITAACHAMQFDVIEIKNVEHLERLSTRSKDLRELVGTLTGDNRLSFGPLNAYHEE